VENYHGRRVETYRLVHEMMRSGALKISALLTHSFGIEDYRVALEVAMNKARYNAVKVALDFRRQRGG
jgi:threonine dehydrogenase-like Zn-dependent dehydrogenase